MALLDAYATADEYRNRVTKSILTDDPAIDAGLLAISRYLERELDRNFNQTDSGTERYFEGEEGETVWIDGVVPVMRGGSRLFIDDLVDIESIDLDLDGDGNLEVTLADFHLGPWNASEKEEPYTFIEIAAGETVTRSFPITSRSIQVVGTWGWPSVPTPIKEATIQLCGILRLDTPRSQATVSEIGQLVQMSSEGSGIVRDLMKWYAHPRQAM